MTTTAKSKTEIWRADDLYNFIADEPDTCDRVSEFLGPDWANDPHRLIEVTIPQHCFRIDSEASFWDAPSIAYAILLVTPEDDDEFHVERSVAAFRKTFGVEPRDTDTCEHADVGSYVMGRNGVRVKNKDDADKTPADRTRYVVDTDLPAEAWD